MREALEIDEKVLGPDSEVVAAWDYDLANILFVKREGVEAEQLYRRAIEIDKRTIGLNNMFVANALNNIASLLREKGDYAGAEPLCSTGD